MHHNSYSEHTMQRLTAASFHTLLFVWVFLLPTNLFWKILPNFGFVGGLQIDYLIPKLFLTDIVGLAVMLCGLWMLWLQTKGATIKSIRTSLADHKGTSVVLGMLLVAYLVRQLFVPFPIAAYWFIFTSLLRLGMFAVIGLLFPHNSRIIPATIFWAILCAICFQSTLGLYQFSKQHEFAGFWFLGEPVLSRSIGIDKTNWSLSDDLFHTQLGLRVAPYGTTPHPNVLSGFLAIGLTVLWSFISIGQLLRSKKGLFVLLASILGLLTLTASQSLTGWVTLGTGCLVLFIRKKASRVFEMRLGNPLRTLWLLALCSLGLSLGALLSLSTLQMGEQSVSRRLSLNQAAITLLQKYPLFGVGANQFTAEVETVLKGRETVRFVQPAHQLVLLFLAENGALGLLLITVFLSTYTSKPLQKRLVYSVALLLPVISFDHYLSSLIQGQLLWGVVVLWLFFGF